MLWGQENRKYSTSSKGRVQDSSRRMKGKSAVTRLCKVMAMRYTSSESVSVVFKLHDDVQFFPAFAEALQWLPKLWAATPRKS